MKIFQHSFLLTLILAMPSCKTVQRDGFRNTISEVSILLPEQFHSLEAHATFSRTDEKSDPKFVKGKDLTIKLPSGIYAVELVLLNSDGNEEYKSCNTSRPYVFKERREVAIVDICKESDRSVVIQTLPNIVIPPIPTPVASPSPLPIPVVPFPIDPVIPTSEPIVSIQNHSLYVSESTCFGQPVLVTQQGDEFVFKINGSIENKWINGLSYLRCNITVNVPKPKGRIFSPLAYQMTYTADDKTLKQNLWFMVSGRDENNNLSLPCTPFLFNASTNSKKNFICSFYDTSAEHLLDIFPKTKAEHDASCQSVTKVIAFSFAIAGPANTLITSLKVPELRIHIPQTEACP